MWIIYISISLSHLFKNKVVKYMCSFLNKKKIALRKLHDFFLYIHFFLLPNDRNRLTCMNIQGILLFKYSPWTLTFATEARAPRGFGMSSVERPWFHTLCWDSAFALNYRETHIKHKRYIEKKLLGGTLWWHVYLKWHESIIHTRCRVLLSLLIKHIMRLGLHNLTFFSSPSNFTFT